MRRPRRQEDLREFQIVEKSKRSEKVFRSLHISEHGLKVALIFPSSYETAISNLGFHKVFELMNGIEGIQCERFFYDKRFSKYYSLDTFRPLDEFHIWAFSVSFELDFQHIIYLLRKKGIPTQNSLRTEHHPLILIGGSVTYFNANALWQTADVIFHGDAEERLQPIMQLLLESFREKKQRIDIFQQLKDFDNLSIPPLNLITKGVSKSLQLTKNPAISLFTTKRSVFPNKVLLEIGRGCLQTCAFCVAGHTRSPARFVHLDIIKNILDEIKTKGFNECGLISATFTDHPFKNEILDLLEERSMRFSVSSLRLDHLSEKLIDGLLRSGQKEITIAPEGGSQKIRDLMNKQISDEDIERSLQLIGKRRIRKLKMYFIYGLEEEDETDLDAIGKITQRAIHYGITDIKISLNPLIPKPGTPFASRQIQDIKTLRAKKQFIEKILGKTISVKFESIRNSMLQYQIANASKDYQFPFER
ncbi:MAG: B12-binding domain-containing radical SAM protein [Thermotogota bacterium]